MSRITSHPILNIPKVKETEFLFEGKTVKAQKGFTIAAALHQADYPVHSHSLHNRNRSLECGIGKCGACEMLVDGVVKRICITKVDRIREVTEIPKDFSPGRKKTEDLKASGEADPSESRPMILRTKVAIIGAGPAGLAVRELLDQHRVENLVIDANAEIGGQFLMQTHQFFFFEKEKKFGGLRGFEIANKLAGEDHSNILLNCTVWDILEGNLLAVKNLAMGEIFYVESEYLVIATGAVPFMPTFENDDLPGVYTAAVVQKMMNLEFTLLGKNVLTVGAGNIGYLTSYQLMQAGARVRAIIEAQPFEGGFPVQANRVRRLGIPIITGKILLKAIPNDKHEGITGAVIADAENFEPVPGTEQVIEDIDAINICTGLVPDDQLLIKGKEIFGRRVWGAGDAIRIGEGTSAVLRGKQVAFEILEEIGLPYDYNTFLQVSKEYIDSQQHPVKVLDAPLLPQTPTSHGPNKPFVVIDCIYGFACNPCVFACPHGAITKSSTSTVPVIDYDKCTGCMQCISQCPGLAIFGYNPAKNKIFLPVEFNLTEENGKEVYLVDNNGAISGEGEIEKLLEKPNKTNVVRIKANDIAGEELVNVRGFIHKTSYPGPLRIRKANDDTTEKSAGEKMYVCHCDDVTLEEVLEVIGDRKYVSIDEIKHTTRLGMGACRGKRCVKRLKTAVRSHGISIVGEPTPRGPMSNQVSLGDLYPADALMHSMTGPDEPVRMGLPKDSKIKHVKVGALIAGGGIGGSALFRYMAEAGLNPVMVNYGHGASWRNIAGGRPAFSVPELADIATHNLHIFEELQKIRNIDFRRTRYVTFAHDEETYRILQDSMSWQDAELIDKKDFNKKISPAFNPGLTTYNAALITRNCWQATPGRTIDLLRHLGLEKGGTILEDCRVVSLGSRQSTDNSNFNVIVQTHDNNYIELEAEIFVNALGSEAEKFANQAGLRLGLFPVRHQAFITRRMPWMGINGEPLPMLIDRRKYKGFSAVYGQQLAETGQIIGCASPGLEPVETDKNLKINSREFLEIISEIFVDWLPALAEIGFQAVWSGYYVEPRMFIDPANGLFAGLRGQGFMLAQYLARLYVDALTGRPVPDYFHRLSLNGDGLPERQFK